MVNLFRILHAEWLSHLVHEYSCLLYIQEHSWCNFAFMNIPYIFFFFIYKEKIVEWPNKNLSF